jgi:hypothetical protein
MPEADQGKRKVMGTRSISIFSLKADEECPELVLSIHRGRQQQEAVPIDSRYADSRI